MSYCACIAPAAKRMCPQVCSCSCFAKSPRGMNSLHPMEHLPRQPGQTPCDHGRPPWPTPSVGCAQGRSGDPYAAAFEGASVGCEAIGCAGNVMRTWGTPLPGDRRTCSGALARPCDGLGRHSNYNSWGTAPACTRTKRHGSRSSGRRSRGRSPHSGT